MAIRTEKLTGKEKAAILLIALGTERASEIYKHLRKKKLNN